MSRIQKAQPNASQNFTLPDGKIVISRTVLREILQLLSTSVPLSKAPTPSLAHYWSAIQSIRLFRAKRLIRRALAEGNSLRGNV